MLLDQLHCNFGHKQKSSLLYVSQIDPSKEILEPPCQWQEPCESDENATKQYNYNTEATCEKSSIDWTHKVGVGRMSLSLRHYLPFAEDIASINSFE